MDLLMKGPPYPCPPAILGEVRAAAMNSVRGGFERHLGLEFTRILPDEVACVVTVRDELTQPYGIVHGGVYASIIETLASTGAGVHELPRGRSTVGLENSTTFLHAVRGGTLTGIARPVHRGKTTHVWEARVTDDKGRDVAMGKVRMIVLDPTASAFGETLKVKT
jgi:1,4-dihydroxy-2-naphthoyl-CoA hydrolase